MFLLLAAFMFTFSLLTNFFALAMPTEMTGLLPEDMTFMAYTQTGMQEDMNSMIDATNISVDSSGETSGDNTLNIAQFGVAWGIFNKLVANIFIGYYYIGIYFADALEASSVGPLHVLFGGIGMIFSIAMIIGLLLMIRSVVFRV